MLQMALLGAWVAASPLPGVPHLAALLCWALATAWTLWAWRVSPEGLLGWDGQHWRWEPSAHAADLSEGLVQVHLDVRSAALVRFIPAQGRARWLWLERRSDRLPQWHLLRCALHAPAHDGLREERTVAP